MRAARSLVCIALLPLFAGCQMLSVFDGSSGASSQAGQTRMQGTLSAAEGRLLFKPCTGEQRYAVKDDGGTSILQEAATLAEKQGTLFADLRGHFSPSQSGGADSEVALSQLYRLERSNDACGDPDFPRLILRASGKAPAWNVDVSAKGMRIERADQPALALPYLEEQLGDGRFNLSSEANNRHVELWVAPQRCVDSQTGSVQHLSAELRVDGQVQRGCAYFGGSRND
ncbi:COG3650 family protein [Pseudomonas sp. MRSN 12121]|uniref:COG3650 family protein n=1 Tax=Pseudomonas sp. MRSN 12121 TaxID=1611770 RepID=UPI0005BEE530|nr:membrane protein [Pseudomonas sp. MRSN 12121]AJO81654.1 membrane protein [Pseudomonas sp. MRSN 12121]